MNKWVAAPIVLLAVTAFGFPLAVVYHTRRTQRLKEAAEKPNPLEKLHAAEPTMAAFFDALWQGPAAAVAGEGPERPDDSGTSIGAEPVVPEKFLHDLPMRIGRLRYFLSEVNRTSDDSVRQDLLVALSQQLLSIKTDCAAPQLLPIWQVVCALERLTRQLAKRQSSINASSLKTVAGGIDLLSILGDVDPEPHIATEPPVRLLVVDDNATCRHALVLALRPAFHDPDVAFDGQAGLAMARDHTYDVIFLDVEMPGADGFVVCTEIKKTALNAATPVVFVTKHSGFDSRAMAALCGGQELIGKPFIPMEVAVKALILVLTSRLKIGRSQKGAETSAPAAPESFDLRDAILRDPAILPGTSRQDLGVKWL